MAFAALREPLVLIPRFAFVLLEMIHGQAARGLEQTLGFFQGFPMFLLGLLDEPFFLLDETVALRFVREDDFLAQLLELVAEGGDLFFKLGRQQIALAAMPLQQRFQAGRVLLVNVAFEQRAFIHQVFQVGH